MFVRFWRGRWWCMYSILHCRFISRRRFGFGAAVNGNLNVNVNANVDL